MFKPVPDAKLTTDEVLCQRCGHILIGSIHNKCIKSLHASAIKIMDGSPYHAVNYYY